MGREILHFSFSPLALVILLFGADTVAQPISVGACLACPVGDDTPCLDGVWVLRERSGTGSDMRVMYSKQWGSLVTSVELVPFPEEEPTSGQLPLFGYGRGMKVWTFCVAGGQLKEIPTGFNAAGKMFRGDRPLEGRVREKQDTIEEGGEVFTRYWFSVENGDGGDIQFRLLMTLGKIDGVYRANTDEFYKYWRENSPDRSGRSLADYLKCLAGPSRTTPGIAGLWASASAIHGGSSFFSTLLNRDLDQIRQDGKFLVLLSDSGLGMHGVGDRFILNPPNIDLGCLDGSDIILANDFTADGCMAAKDQSGKRVFGRVEVFENGAVCYGRVFGVIDRSFRPSGQRLMSTEYESKCRVETFKVPVEDTKR